MWFHYHHDFWSWSHECQRHQFWLRSADNVPKFQPAAAQNLARLDRNRPPKRQHHCVTPLIRPIWKKYVFHLHLFQWLVSKNNDNGLLLGCGPPTNHYVKYWYLSLKYYSGSLLSIVGIVCLGLYVTSLEKIFRRNESWTQKYKFDQYRRPTMNLL